MNTALFIGGTKGLGLELARLACVDEWEVTVAGRSANDCALVHSRQATPLTIDLEHLVIPSGLPKYALIVWAAGKYQTPADRLTMVADHEIESLCRNHLIGPIQLLSELIRVNREGVNRGGPIHLIVIGSSSAFISRENEIVYDAMKAAKAHFTRGLAKELVHGRPGSKVTLAHPGGMATPFWDGRDQDVSRFMDPAAVARMIWDQAMQQTESFAEFRVVRQPDRTPKLELGPILPT